MLELKRLDHYTINFPEGEEASVISFYKEKLQLEQIESLVPKTIWFAMGEIELHLSIGTTDLKDPRHVAFVVEDLEKTRTFLAERNVVIESASKIKGRERFFFRDPFGNRFELIEFLK